MARSAAKVQLPPPARSACWAEYLKWVLGIPVVVAGALGVVWAALWLTGGAGLMPKTEGDMGTVLMWLVLIVLIYPVMLVVWTLDLRDGLRAARRWDALSEAERQAELQAQPQTPRRKKGRRE